MVAPVATVAPAPPAPSKPAPANCEQYRPLLAAYDWDVSVALAVMQAESGCNPRADNTGLNRDGSNDKGLMQINSIHRDLVGDTERFDPAANIRAAWHIYHGSGWRAWSAYNSGAYKKYL